MSNIQNIQAKVIDEFCKARADYPGEVMTEMARAREEGACGECVCHHIAGYSWFPCALPRGHEGGHRARAECFEHGVYLGEPWAPPRCPRCPEPSTCQATLGPGSVSSTWDFGIHGATGETTVYYTGYFNAFQFVPVEPRVRQHFQEASSRWLSEWRKAGGR